MFTLFQNYVSNEGYIKTSFASGNLTENSRKSYFVPNITEEQKGKHIYESNPI